MAHLSLLCTDLGTSWQPLVSVGWCFRFVVVANVDWDWCTDTVNVDQTLAYQTIASFSREAIIDVGGTDARFFPGSTICYVRGHVAGKIWIKYFS